MNSRGATPRPAVQDLHDRINNLERQLESTRLLLSSFTSQHTQGKLMVQLTQIFNDYFNHPYSPKSVLSLHRACRAAIGSALHPHTPWVVEPEFEEAFNMFTQQHYKQLAQLIKEQRLKIENDAVHGTSELAATAKLRHEAVSEFQAALLAVLKKDNPKFNDLRFIQAASNHDPEGK